MMTSLSYYAPIIGVHQIESHEAKRGLQVTRERLLSGRGGHFVYLRIIIIEIIWCIQQSATHRWEADVNPKETPL